MERRSINFIWFFCFGFFVLAFFVFVLSVLFTHILQGYFTNTGWNRVIMQNAIAWWRHRMETFSMLLAFLGVGNSPVTGEFSTPKKASDAELWCFLWCAPNPTLEQTMETPSHSLLHPFWKKSQATAMAWYPGSLLSTWINFNPGMDK